MFLLSTRNTEENQRSSTTSLNMSSLLKPSSQLQVDDFDGSSFTQELSFLSDDMDISSSNSSTAHEDEDVELCPNSVLLNDYETDSLADLSVESSSSPPRSQQQQQLSSSTGALRTGCLRRASSGGSSSTSSSSSTRSVRFADAHIRKYAVCVGDNPAVSLGVPVSLDWQVVSEETFPVVDALHLEERYHCLTEEELRLPSEEREAMVRNAGFSTEEIRTSVRAVNQAKMEREKTLDTLKNQKGEYRMEKLRKGVWNATVRRRTKKMERALLKDLLKQDQQRILEVAQ